MNLFNQFDNRIMRIIDRNREKAKKIYTVDYALYTDVLKKCCGCGHSIREGEYLRSGNADIRHMHCLDGKAEIRNGKVYA